MEDNETVALGKPDVAVVVATGVNMKLLDPVLGTVRLAVQRAPVGQQAMLSAASREQFVPSRQHTLELSRSVHGLYPAGQTFARLRICRTSKARSVVSRFLGG